MPPNELILAFDTSAAHCAVALLSGNEILADVTLDMAKGQAERIMPLIEETLTSQGLGWTDITRIGVGVGPGNFTGIRISVSAARGLALSLGVPAIGVTSFEALAFGTNGPTLTSVDARGGRIYVQEFDGEPTSDPYLITTDEVPTLLSENHRTSIGYLSDLATDQKTANPAYSTPVAIAMIAAQRDAKTAGRPAPLYIRAPDAAPSKIIAPTITP